MGVRRAAPEPALPRTDPWAWFFMAPKGMASSPWGQRMPAHHHELTPDHSVTLTRDWTPLHHWYKLCI